MNTTRRATGLAGRLDPATIARLEAMTRAAEASDLPAPAPTREQRKPRPDKSAKTFRRCQAIRDRYADGEPLRGDDMQLLVAVLGKHPHAKKKIGPGIHAITCGTYIGGSRCFFVIRTDGTIEDFSIRKCLNRPTTRRTARVAALMARFSYEIIRRAFLAHRRATQAGTGAAR